MNFKIKEKGCIKALQKTSIKNIINLRPLVVECNLLFHICVENQIHKVIDFELLKKEVSGVFVVPKKRRINCSVS